VIHHSDSPSGSTLCVGAVVLRGDKALFVRQTYGKLKGTWSLPWGFVDGMRADGCPEPPDEAAIRETQEEAGVAARVEGLLGIQHHGTEEGKLGLYICVTMSAASRRPTITRQTELPTFPWTRWRALTNPLTHSVSG
jgi:ADP-ribose pyrophosphatase YjhB (NUDIX family)